MGISYNPSIVTEGLVLALDPHNPRFSNYKGRSVDFDGTGDRLSITASTDFDIGSAKTWECWFKLDTISTNELLMGSLSNHWLNIGYSAIGGSANKVAFSPYDGSNWNAINSTTSIAAGSWYHVAVTWDGTYAKLYLNGVLEATSADWSAKTWASNNGNPYEISGYSGDDATSIDGAISNLRITDSVLYTSNFTPPTEPLTAVTNTKLLTCQDTTFTDASSSAHSITPNGNAAIHYNGPFSGSGWTDLMNNGNNGTLTNGPVFIPGGPFNNIGGSVEFDGDSDSLTVAASTDFTLDGEFTVEFWIYLNTIVLDSQHPSPITFSQSGGNKGQIYLNVSNKFFSLWNGTDVVDTGNNSVTTGRWYHVAVTRDSSNNCRIFLDGVLKDTASSTFTFGNASGDLRIGSFNGTGGDVNGYISNLRILKGTALYTAAFTPPTGPLEAIDDTVLLTCQGGAITDNGPNSHAITVNNDAEAITASAFELDGTNDCVDVTNNANLYPGTGDFTAEVWCRGETAASAYYYLLSNYGNSGSNYYGWWISTQSNGSGIVAGMASGSGATSVTISNTTVNLNDSNWHHVVFVRSGNAIRLYHNGEQLESDGDVTGYNVTSSEAKFRIGKVRDAADPNGGYYFWNGKISGVKIYKGKGLTAAEVTQNYNATKGRYA